MIALTIPDVSFVLAVLNNLTIIVNILHQLDVENHSSVDAVNISFVSLMEVLSNITNALHLLTKLPVSKGTSMKINNLITLLNAFR